MTTNPDNPAQLLRRAADRLRELATAVEEELRENPYWQSEHAPPHDYPSVWVRGIDNALGGPAGALAAVMGPGVGHPATTEEN